MPGERPAGLSLPSHSPSAIPVYATILTPVMAQPAPVLMTTPPIRGTNTLDLFAPFHQGHQVHGPHDTSYAYPHKEGEENEYSGIPHLWKAKSSKK